MRKNGAESMDANEVSKFITVTYRSNGEVDVESNNMTVFDLWALSNYVKMRADEAYITQQTANRMKEAGNNQKIQRVQSMPSGMK